MPPFCTEAIREALARAEEPGLTISGVVFLLLVLLTLARATYLRKWLMPGWGGTRSFLQLPVVAFRAAFFNDVHAHAGRGSPWCWRKDSV